MGKINTKYHRIGEESFNKYGSKMVIEIYNNANDIWVKFTESNNLVNTSYFFFRDGTVKNPYDKSIFNVGYLGKGEYKGNINKKRTNQYETWKNMLMRCYSNNYHEKQPTYKNCNVIEVWHNFQNFAKWYDENFYQIEGEEMELDKDILKKGNKAYSPENCVFVPKFINTLFVKANLKRGILPIGVTWSKRHKKYQSQCSIKSGRNIIGYFDTPEEAFFAYKKFKEQLIKNIANKYKYQIPDKLYYAMINYIVDITD